MSPASPPRLHRTAGAAIAFALGVVAMAAGVQTVSKVDAAPSRPASPEAGRAPVSHQFRVPTGLADRADGATVICQVLVSAKGKVMARKCAQQGGSRALVGWLRDETHRRLERARFRPALWEGSRVAVSMAMRVQVTCDERRTCEVGVYPNAALHRASLGEDYFAPQEIIRRTDTWYDRLVASDDCRGGHARFCKGQSAFAFAVEVSVGADGRVLDVGELDSVEPGDFPVAAAAQHLYQTHYIAAQAAGQSLALHLHAPTLHKKNSRHFPRDQCRRVNQVGVRLGISCFTMQELAAHRSYDDGDGPDKVLSFWRSEDDAAG